MTIYFSLDHILVNKINYNLSKYSASNLPLEVVIGKFKGVFTKNLGEEIFNKLHTYLNSSEEFTVTRNVSCITTSGLEKFDIDLTQYNIRLQLIKNTYSTEGVTYEYKHNSKSHSFRISHKKGGGEYSASMICRIYDISDLLAKLKIFLEPIVKSNFLISYAERRQVTDCYNFLVKKQNKNPVIIFNKPYNLTREQLPDILKSWNNFLLFPKLDGIRYLAYITDGGCYMLNYTEFLKISDNEDKSFDNTLLDGEMIDNIYYPFDVIFWKGDDIRKKNRVERLSYLNQLTVNFKIKIILPEYSIHTGIEKYLISSYSIPTDGIILVSNNTSYNNSKTYKYKLNSNQMIDFEVGSNQKLLIKNYDGTLTPFTGSPENPYDPETPIRDNLGICSKGKIVEFKWIDGIFESVRSRPDKIYPNFIEVSRVIWNEINDPIILYPQNNISTIEIDKVCDFQSPISNNLVRTGTIADGSCMFHSIFYSNENYKNLTSSRKHTFVKEMRELFSKNIKIEDWFKLGSGEVSRVSYEYLFTEFFKKIYITTLYESDKLKNNIYHTLFSKYNLDFFTDTFFPILYSLKLKSEDVKEHIKETVKSIFFKEDTKTIDAIQILCCEILKISVECAFKKFISKIKNSSEWVDQTMLEFICNRVDKDIYILDISTGLPSAIPGYEKILKGRKSVIVGYISESHFESIGLKIDNHICREFDKDHPLIVLLRRFYS